MKNLKKNISHIPKTTLSSKCDIKIRFNEVDSLQIVWHGHYFKYFEDGRESFGLEHEIDYLKVYNKGFSIPIVEMHCFNKKPIHYGDKCEILTTFIPSSAAKIIFDYHLYKIIDNKKELVATGRTVQVFVNRDGNLEFFNPPFYETWKNKYNL